MALMSFNIPTTAMPTSYTGLGSAWQNFASNQVLPIVSRLVGNFGAFAQPYQQAGGMASQYLQSQLLPSIQGVLNKLAGRGVLNSSVASDALAKTSSMLGGQTYGVLSSLLGQAARAYPTTLLQTAELGKYAQSTDASAPYRIMADMLASLM